MSCHWQKQGGVANKFMAGVCCWQQHDHNRVFLFKTRCNAQSYFAAMAYYRTRAGQARKLARPFSGTGAKCENIQNNCYAQAAKIDKRIQIWVPHYVIQSSFPPGSRTRILAIHLKFWLPYMSWTAHASSTQKMPREQPLNLLMRR